ncbi:MAG: hypothetical protein ACRDHZ_26180, partial [Ktedonobacteraceae bacterium]
MKIALLCSVLLLTVPGVVMGQDGGKTSQQSDIPAAIQGTFEDMGIPQEKYELVYRALKKSCNDIHDFMHEPHNAYAVKAGDCYVVYGKAVQQISKEQVLFVQLTLAGETDNYFLGNFPNFSEIVSDGKFQKLGYSPAEGDTIIAIAGGAEPFKYDATDGTTKTV